MKAFWKVGVPIALAALAAITMSNMFDDGGLREVLKDEVPPLLDQWEVAQDNNISRYAASIPASIAVSAGFRAGDADYDKPSRYDDLTQNIPYAFHDEIMQNDNLAAAQRARQRQLMRVASENTDQLFFDLFPEWWTAQTACMTPDEKLDTIRQLAPAIAEAIDAKNTAFEALAAREAAGSLTVAERTAYLNDKMRVPHLKQLPANSWQDSGDWIEVDLSDPPFRHENDRPLVQKCPTTVHSHGGHIKACFGYVNINLHGYFGQWPGYGHRTPTLLGHKTYQSLERSGTKLSFVLDMMESQTKRAALLKQAEEVVANLPASDVATGFEDWRVQAEFKKLQCAK